MDMAMEMPDPKWTAVIALSFILGPVDDEGAQPDDDTDAYRDYTLDFISSRCDYVWQLSLEKRS